MDVYGMFQEDNETFIKYDMCICINLHKIVTILTVEVLYQTKISDVYKKIQDFLHNFGTDMGEYEEHHFVYINSKGEEEQLFNNDWCRFVRDLNICSPVSADTYAPCAGLESLFHTMKLEQTHGSIDTNRYKLEKMIGIKENVMVKVVPSEEYAIFEKFSKKLLLGFNQEFSKSSFEERLLHEHPIEMVTTKPLPSGDINISVGYQQTEAQTTLRTPQTQTVQNRTLVVNVGNSISMVIGLVLRKFKERGENIQGSSDYMLKVADKEEYLVSSSDTTELARFKYIEDCLRLKTTAELVLIPKKAINNTIPSFPRSSRVDAHTLTNLNENAFKETLLPNGKFIYTHNLWKRYSNTAIPLSYNHNFEINDLGVGNVEDALPANVLITDTFQPEDLMYCIEISKIDLQKGTTIPRDHKIIIVMGLYHGRISLCENQYKEYKEVPGDGSSCSIFFPIEIWNLPRMARLSFGLMLVKQTITKDYANAPQRKFLGWGNLMMYDHNAVLKTETVSYCLWTCNKQNLNPTASVYSNPDGNVIAPEIKMELLPKLRKFIKIVYPPKDILIQEAGMMIGNEHETTPSKEDQDLLSEILKRCPMDDILGEEQLLLWKYRYYIRDCFQDSLPKMLNTLPWNNFVNVAKMHHLACGWPVEKVVIFALELLGPDSFDSDIRMMAVESLQRLSWYEFSRYLLQICQCLKYESYLNSNFTQMFLKRMTQNAKIAQSMFYFMKVEMSACEWSKVNLCIILYHYLQYSPTRCESLLRQNTAMTELCQHNKILKHFSTLDGDKKAEVLKKFQQSLSENRVIFDNLPCPIDPNIVLKSLNSQRCKFMDSKMRPVRLLWTVNQAFKKDYSIIYKNGDDLRQDALIVQLLHIMDSIWQNDGIDLKLNPYEVIACSKTEGYIQVVQQAETLANIYKSVGNKRKLFYDWLKKNTQIDMGIVVQNFKRSCAAYCVATFVLGIGDRHSDNIMITTDGHLFHIDFGHILGNFKKIMGGMVSREWTKFILVQDFLDVVANGEFSDTKEQEFKNLCIDGYIALRKHSNLIISLFKMMLGAEIPEISGLDDLNYLKETLQIGKSEEDARLYFQNVYNDTRKKEMFVSMNWLAHGLNRNNN